MAYRASAKGGFGVTADTPKKAAQAFFAQFPEKRKCNILQGEVEGQFFVVKYGQKSQGEWPASFKDISKKQVDGLPG